VEAALEWVAMSVIGGGLRYSERHLSFGVSGGLLRQERGRPLRCAALLDEYGTSSSEPDVEVVAVIGGEADLRRLDERHVDGDASAALALGRLLVVAALVRRVLGRLTWRHRRQLDCVAQPVHHLCAPNHSCAVRQSDIDNGK